MADLVGSLFFSMRAALLMGWICLQGCAHPSPRSKASSGREKPTTSALAAPLSLLWSEAPPGGSPQWHSTAHSLCMYQRGTHLMCCISPTHWGPFPWSHRPHSVLSLPHPPIRHNSCWLSLAKTSCPIVLLMSGVCSIGYLHRKRNRTLLPDTKINSSWHADMNELVKLKKKRTFERKPRRIS